MDSSMNSLAQLAQHTTIVADTGDLTAIARLKPQDATTNPALITAAFKEGISNELTAKIQGLDTEDAIDALTVHLGYQISQLITGRVSTEVDARLSYDTDATIDKALKYIEQYHNLGLSNDRILIKIAATWQGIQAAKILERQGVHCNLTLLFTDIQAKACADAGVTLISPFVGRITDWQKQQQNQQQIAIAEDLGVKSVKNIYQFYKKHGYQTQVMGASFRSIDQIIALAGCDLLTISPTLLDELTASTRPVPLSLRPETLTYTQPDITDAQSFQQIQEAHALNDLLTKGIKGFIDARDTLAQQLSKTLG